MTENQTKLRTKAFALRVLKLVDAVPDTRSGRIVAGQLGRAATSVGANYRSVCRARSAADMIAKLPLVEEEADESAFWLELTYESGMVHRIRVDDLLREAGELTAIMVASRKTLRRNNQRSKIENRKSP